jgi:hypothetical protein
VKQSFEKEIELLESLTKRSASLMASAKGHTVSLMISKEERETLDHIQHVLQWMADKPAGLSVRKHHKCDEWAIYYEQTEGWRPEVRIGVPILEHRNDRARLVIDIEETDAKFMRQELGFPMQPQPLEAIDAIVRATHALAGAAIELTHVARKFQEKK